MTDGQQPKGKLIAIREGAPGDAPAIVAIHQRSYRESLRSALPQAWFDTFFARDRIAEWTAALGGAGDAANEKTWIAECDGAAVGYVTAGPCRDDDVDDSTGEVYTIYALPEVWGMGVGAALMNTALAWLRTTYRDAVVSVLDVNERALRFYEAAGWKPDGHRDGPYDSAGVDVYGLRYCLEL